MAQIKTDWHQYHCPPNHLWVSIDEPAEPRTGSDRDLAQVVVDQPELLSIIFNTSGSNPPMGILTSGSR